jgi:hypothetical protein
MQRDAPSLCKSLAAPSSSNNRARKALAPALCADFVEGPARTAGRLQSANRQARAMAHRASKCLGSARMFV